MFHLIYYYTDGRQPIGDYCNTDNVSFAIVQCYKALLLHIVMFIVKARRDPTPLATSRILL